MRGTGTGRTRVHGREVRRRTAAARVDGGDGRGGGGGGAEGDWEASATTLIAPFTVTLPQVIFTS